MNINIGGKNFSFTNGSNIQISNGKVVVDGKEIHSGDNHQTILVEVTGDVNVLRTDNSATINGNVLSFVDAGNSVKCRDVSGDVDAGNSVHAQSIQGKVKAGNSIYYK